MNSPVKPVLQNGPDEATRNNRNCGGENIIYPPKRPCVDLNRPKLPISLIVTCFNEGHNVAGWCQSLLAMDAWPGEVVVSDSNSTDDTVAKLREYLEGKGFDLVIIPGRCSISEGRNRAVARSRFEHLAITDFGVTFDRQWLSALNQSLSNSDWVGGCYKMTWQNPVQRAYGRLFDVDPDSLNEQSFLPSSRSFAQTKAAFQAAGGYDTKLMLGEDTALVLHLRNLPLRYRLERQAVVYWLPRKTLRAIYLQHYRYAYWDGLASQNAGRWLHLLFWSVITLAPFAALASPVWLMKLGLSAGAMAILFAKVSCNTLRGTSRSWARPLDIVVYYVTTTSSVFGYVSGKLHGLLSRRT